MHLLDKNQLGPDEDWYGSNAAIRCPHCGKVFLSSQVLHRKGRVCPGCGKTKVLVLKHEVQVTDVQDEAARLAPAG